ncbi:MAG: siphovirus Gp157 family protein [Rhodocyclaceae bacterium]|nr:siphovirus Gp157 family protein [Rhodocyclaceae bacterium]
MSLPALYELAAEYRQAMQTLAEMDLPEEVVRDTLEGLHGDLHAKATNVAACVRNLEATAQVIRQAEEQMAARRKAIEARAERIRQYLLDNLRACGIQRIESPWFVIALRDNPPSVDVFDEAQLPPEFIVCPPPPDPKPDKRAILAALKAGQAVPGARMVRGQRVEIK